MPASWRVRPSWVTTADSCVASSRNLFGPLAVTSALPDSVTERSGAVVNVASVLSWLALGAATASSRQRCGAQPTRCGSSSARTAYKLSGVYMGYVDTDMAAGVEGKTSPAGIVAQVLEGIESGAFEILADDLAGDVRASLNQPVGARYAPFLP
jgi:hypothetical protein